MHRVKVRVVEDALDANNTIARANRADFDAHGVTVINLMSSPGAGKTTLLEALLAEGIDGVRVGVLEGDVQGSMDADRLASLHVPVTQLNTDPGFGGECHLDANMVRSALPELPLHDIDLLIIENVGNLVCPAEFRVGEDARIMVCSVAEGEDKPLKYPLMFRACELVVVNTPDGEPLRLAALRDRVVLLEFWTFACVNCRRTLPFLRRMHDRYQPDFTVVGVHSPEFAFERSVQNVERAVREHGLQYPVGLDNDFVAWMAYGNRYWPTMYLIDRAGQIRYTQIGEGNYSRTEAAIRTLLAEAVGPAAETRAAS